MVNSAEKATQSSERAITGNGKRVSGDEKAVPKRGRLLAFVVYAVGIVDLVVRGWRAEGLLLLLAAVAVAGISASFRGGWLALGISTVVLIAIGLVSPGSPVPPTTLWLGGTLAFLVSGALVLWTLRRLTDRSEEKLSRARQEERALARTVLDTRFDALQARNQLQRHRIEYLEAAYAVLRAISGVTDTGELLDTAAETIAERFGFALVTIYIIDEAGEWATLRSASSVEGKQMALRGFRVWLGGGGPIALAATDSPSLILSYSERQQQERRQGDRPGVEGTQSTVTLPLVVAKRRIGVLDIYEVDGRLFDEDDIALLETVAGSLAAAIDGAEHLSETGSAFATTNRVYRTAVQLATARSEREVYQILVEAVGSYETARVLVVQSGLGNSPSYPVDRVSVGRARFASEPRILIDLSHGELIHDAYALPELRNHSDAANGSYEVPPALFDVLVFGLALDEPLWVEDLSNLPAVLSPELRGALQGFAEVLEASASDRSRNREVTAPSGSAIGALAFIPIRRDDISIGLGLLMLYENVHAFTKPERQLHQLLTDLSGPSLHRSRLVADAQSREDREAFVTAVGERLWGSLDTDTILSTAVAEIGRALNADVAEIEIVSELREYATDATGATDDTMSTEDGSADPNGAEAGDGLTE